MVRSLCSAWPAAVALAAVVTLPPGRLPAQDVLQRVRQAADGPAESVRDDRPRNVDSGADGCEEDDDDNSFLGTLLFYALATPVWLPRTLLADDGTLGWFPGHPYSFTDLPYLAIRPDFPDSAGRAFFDPERLECWTTRATVEDGILAGGVNRLGGRFLFDSAWRVGLAANTDFLRTHTASGTDHLTLGDIDLTWRFAQADWMQMRLGAGARGMFDSQRSWGGVNVLYGAELFPRDPWVVAVQAEVGNLHSAAVTRLRGTVGVQLQHLELFAGYDWLRIGPVDLHGPLVGLRLWF